LTLSELRDRAYDRLGIDATEQTALALDSTLNEYLNEANRQAAIWSKSLVASTMITTLAKVPNYDLPSDCVAVLAVFRSSPRTKVYPFDQRDLDEYRRNWRESPSDHATNYMVFNTNELWLLPVPSAASEDYLVYYYQDPGETSMAADSDEPDIAQRWHRYLADYAAARYLARFGGKEKHGKVIHWMRKFTKAVRELATFSQREHEKANHIGRAWPTGATP